MRSSAAPAVSLAVSTDPLAVAVDAYAGAILARHDRAVADATLAEPTLRAPDLVARTIDTLLETLAGLATGRAIGAVLARTRHGFGRELAATIARAGARAIGTLPVVEPEPLYGLDHEPVRSLGSELRQRLRRRIALSGGDIRGALVEIAGAVVATAPAERHALVRVLTVLAGDTALSEPFIAHIATGWRCAVAVLEATPWPDDAGPLWTAWRRRLRREREVITPTHEEVVARGFVMRIG